MWPLLQNVTNYSPCRQHEDVLKELLGVHARIVGSFGEMMEVKLGELINVVVQAYEESYASCALSFVGVAVEKFGARGGGVEDSFCGLLTHLIQLTCTHVQKRGISEVPHLIFSFFEMAQKFLLFCPGALVKSSEFSLLYSFAVACLTQCKGERDSTRQALIFLTQIIGRKGIRLSDITVQALESSRSVIDVQTAQHGSEIVKSCFVSLAGGAPQMLQSNFSDCLYAIVTHVIGADSDNGVVSLQGEGSVLVQSWVVAALQNEGIPEILGNEDKEIVMRTMFKLATGGVKLKGKFKSLLQDFSKICLGEMSSDGVLTVYDLSE